MVSQSGSEGNPVKGWLVAWQLPRRRPLSHLDRGQRGLDGCSAVHVFGNPFGNPVPDKQLTGQFSSAAKFPVICWCGCVVSSRLTLWRTLKRCRFYLMFHLPPQHQCLDRGPRCPCVWLASKQRTYSEVPDPTMQKSWTQHKPATVSSEVGDDAWFRQSTLLLPEPD